MPCIYVLENRASILVQWIMQCISTVLSLCMPLKLNLHLIDYYYSLFLILSVYVQESSLRPTAECSLVVAVSSSVLITFIVTSIIFFIVGFTSGRYFKLSKGKLHITTTDQPQQGPVYDYVQPSTAQCQENLELKVDIAYLPSRSVTVEH